MSIAARASINAGADQSGKITIVDGDVVQPKLADYTGVGTILWEIISYPTGFSTPSGWTAATGRFYWQGSAATGYVPPSIDFTGAPWGMYWFRVTIDNGISGDDIDLDETRDETLAVEILSGSGLRDVPVVDSSLAIPGETFRLVWGPIQANLRIFNTGLLPVGSATGQAAQWNNTSSAWEIATGILFGTGYVSIGGNAPTTSGLNLSNGDGIQGKDAGGTERQIAKIDPSTGDTLLGRVQDVRVGSAYIGIGSTPAPDGSYTAIGLTNARYIVQKSSGGSDAYILGLDGTDDLLVGQDTVVVATKMRALTSVIIRTGGTDRLEATSAGIDCKAQPLQNYRNARGNPTSLPGSGSGLVALKVTGDTTTLTLSSIAPTNSVNTIAMLVRVEDSDGSDAYTDEFRFHLKHFSSTVRVTSPGETPSEGATAQLASLTGPDSGYTYQLDLSHGADTLQLSLTDHATQARITRVTSWWDVAEDLS